jgi:phosphohistidine swiveling domain-containing protein
LICGLPERFAARYPALLDTNDLAAFAAALRGPTLAALDAERTTRALDSFARDLHLAPPSPEPARLRLWLARLELRTAARFALVARQAFAIDALLRSAVEVGVLDAAFLAELRQTATVGVDRATGGDDGHVRAGTFEIAAPTRREFGCGPCASRAARVTDAARTPDHATLQRLRDALHGLGLPIEPDALFAHYRRLLHAREFGKFVLARGVSLALDALAAHAHTLGLERDAAGWLGLDELLDTPADAHDLHARIEQARARHTSEGRLRMPLLMTSPYLDVVHHAPGQANYLGRGRVAGRPIMVDAATHPDRVPIHAIVAIASANPGYDWIFVRQPAALVTAFGGPNSHMAVRCAEAGVPALFGLGPEAFRRIASAARLSIDFDGRTWTMP